MMSNQRGLIEDRDWVRYYLSNPFDRMPGERFSYDIGCTYILSAVVQQISGETTLDFLTPRLFEPLGLEKPYWETCPMGRSLGGAGLFLRTKELLPFGQLCLQHGVYNGKQLVSAEYLAQAASKQIDTQPDAPKDSCCGYGYQFWMCHNGTYRADGAYAQFLIMDEETTQSLRSTQKATAGRRSSTRCGRRLRRCLQSGSKGGTALNQKDIARINELARKAKTPEGLTRAEEEERAMLRGAYIEEFRSNLKSQLENTYIVDENGNKRKVKRKK